MITCADVTRSTSDPATTARVGCVAGAAVQSAIVAFNPIEEPSRVTATGVRDEAGETTSFVATCTLWCTVHTSRRRCVKETATVSAASVVGFNAGDAPGVFAGCTFKRTFQTPLSVVISPDRTTRAIGGGADGAALKVTGEALGVAALAQRPVENPPIRTAAAS